MEKGEKQSQETETPEVQPEETNEDSKTVEEIKAEAAKWKAIADRKSKKLDELKNSLEDKEETKSKEEPNKTKQEVDTSDFVSREEAYLIADGLKADDIIRAKLVAKEKGITLLEAAKDEYVQDKIKERQQGEEDKRAGLGASTTPNTGKIDPNQPGLSEEDHYKLWKESQK